MESSLPAASEVPSHRAREAQLAVWNTLKLASSLMLTWGVALGVRALLPRYLGPAEYGAYSFAAAVAVTFFVFSLVVLGLVVALVIWLVQRIRRPAVPATAA